MVTGDGWISTGTVRSAVGQPQSHFAVTLARGAATLLLGASGPSGTWLERAVSPHSSWSTSFERRPSLGVADSEVDTLKVPLNNGYSELGRARRQSTTRST